MRWLPCRWALATLAMWLGATALGCGAETRSEVSADMSAIPEDRSAALDKPPELPPSHYVLDFGDPAHQPRLLSGWWRPERQADSSLTWVWAKRRAEVEIELASASYRVLELRCWPFVYEGAPAQTLELTLNNRKVATLELAEDDPKRTLTLPEDVLAAGRNRLGFRFAYAASPADVEPGNPDRRKLAAACDVLRLLPGDAGEGAARSATYPTGDPPRFFDAVETYKVTLDGETRNAVAARAAVPLERRLPEVAAGSSLTLALGLACHRPCAGAWTFRVEARTSRGSHAEVLLERTLGTHEPPYGWVEERLDLASLAGSRPELTFSVDPADREPDLPMARAFWGEPFLMLPASAPPPNVLLISIDTLRADHLGAYGYGRDTSPVLDTLAAGGVRFTQAVSQSPWTTPSHMTLMTSLHPSAHGVHQGWKDFAAFAAGRGTYRTPPLDAVTLAQTLRRHGYRTLAVTGGTTIAGELGFWRGFDVYHQSSPEGFRHLTPRVEALLERQLEAHRDIPFFFFFHTFEVHAPYATLDFAAPLLSDAQHAALEALLAEAPADPIAALRRRLQELGLYRPEITTALYDGGIRFTDAALGRLFATLRRLGLWQRTLVLVTSDHGEEFADHDPSRFYDAHCNTVYDELLRVPLVYHLPGMVPAGRVVDMPSGLIDVAPTILDLVDVPMPASMRGTSRRRLLAGGAPADEAWTLSEATCIGPEQKALRSSRRKYIAAFAPREGERGGVAGELLWERLYDLEADPREKHSLHDDDPSLTAALRRRLHQRFAAMAAADLGHASTTPVGDELREKLRSLGYLD